MDDSNSDILITRHPKYGNLTKYSNCTEMDNQIMNCTYIYVPKQFQTGLDSFTYEIRYQNNTHDIITKIERLRIKVTPIMTKGLLKMPKNYQMRESTTGLTRQIQSNVFTNSTFQQVVSFTDPWLTRRYNTCAVVGNGGSLKGKQLGAEIDLHDVVFRLNGAPIEQYSEDVGTKFNIGFASVRWAELCWNWDMIQNNTEKKYSGYEVLGQALYANHWGYLPDCIRNHPEYQLHLISYKFVELADSVLQHYLTSVLHEHKTKLRSSGFMAVIAASMICDHLTLYGFASSTDKKPYHHYWDSSTGKTQWKGHSYEAEKEFYKDLVTRNSNRYKQYFEVYGMPIITRFGDMHRE